MMYTICRNTLIIKLYSYVGSLRDLSEMTYDMYFDIYDSQRHWGYVISLKSLKLPT